MVSVTVEEVGGKVRYKCRSLAEWVPRAVEDLVGACDPLQVILFGSVARGEDGPDSDIDLLVVLPHVEPERRHQLMVDLHRALTVPAPVDVFVTDPRELGRRRA
jgi:predicted nucleotidyltransferase